MRRRISAILRITRTCVDLAAANLLHRKLRLWVALGGTGVALLLILLQVAFLQSVQTKVTSIYDLFDFDIAVVPAAYQIIYYSGTLDRARLAQARAVAGVADGVGFNIASSDWTSLPSRRQSSLLVLGVDDGPDFVRDGALREGLSALRDGHSVLIDDYSLPGLGPTASGTSAEIRGQHVTIVGHFALGLFFYADGSVFVGNRDFTAFTGQPTRDISMVFLHVAKGADPIAVQARLARELPDDVQVLRRDELLAQERGFFITTKPIGVILEAGMLTAFIVGAVILYQVLATDVTNRMKEHAILKAMGFPPGLVYGIGLVQAAGLTLGGLVLATVAGSAILRFVEVTTHLSTGFSLSLLATGGMVALAMCVASVAMVLRRVQRADPAELF